MGEGPERDQLGVQRVGPAQDTSAGAVSVQMAEDPDDDPLARL